MVPAIHSVALAILLITASRLATAEEIIINERDLFVAPSGVALAVGLEVPPEDRSREIVGRRLEGAAPDLLRRLDAEGATQGFAGIIYDNRDRGHSRLDPDLFPRLNHLTYGFELMAVNADYGLAGGILLPAVVFGNSSTSFVDGPAPRSLPRYAMTTPGLPEDQARLYPAHHLYIYPEHRDHDGVDLYPANWTYTLTSQGSSGSDRPFLEAIAMTLAAFPRDTFERLQKESLVMPTVQMILRRTLATVETREDYLSGAAHPVVFDASLLRPERMVAAAAALRPEEIPPLVRIRVVSEDFQETAGLAGLSERLFDTPSAIARVWRDFSGEREMIVSAEATTDPNGRPLAFSWRLLQGLPDRVVIAPLDPSGHRVRLRIRWHDPFPVSTAGAARLTSRVDIGVFASNGVTDSAPAFISVSFPSHEIRSYGLAGDGSMRLQSVDYDAAARDIYFDPNLHWTAPWTDRPVFDRTGAIGEWVRTTTGGEVSTVPHTDSADVTARYRVDRTEPSQPALVAVGETSP
jgi:hypothetical protein